MLVPLAVGPESNTDAAIPFDQQYVTLGESLALALDYDAPVAATDLYHDFGHNVSGANPVLAKVDHGCLALDRFTPFYDKNGDNMFTFAAGANRSNASATRAVRKPMNAGWS